MTPAERLDPKILNGSRRLRIARGSGTTVTEVNRLVERFYEARKMMKQMAGAAGLPGMRRASKKNAKKGKKGKSGGSRAGRAPMRAGGQLPPNLGLPPGMSLPPGLSPDLSNLKLPGSTDSDG
jgi:signal recognition particle subunit SRP54